MPHQGHFLDSDVPVAGILFNSPLHGEYFPVPGPVTRLTCPIQCVCWMTVLWSTRRY